jgi:hypothetical protein
MSRLSFVKDLFNCQVQVQIPEQRARRWSSENGHSLVASSNTGDSRSTKAMLECCRIIKAARYRQEKILNRRKRSFRSLCQNDVQRKKAVIETRCCFACCFLPRCGRKSPAGPCVLILSLSRVNYERTKQLYYEVGSNNYIEGGQV